MACSQNKVMFVGVHFLDPSCTSSACGQSLYSARIGSSCACHSGKCPLSKLVWANQKPLRPERQSQSYHCLALWWRSSYIFNQWLSSSLYYSPSLWEYSGTSQSALHNALYGRCLRVVIHLRSTALPYHIRKVTYGSCGKTNKSLACSHMALVSQDEVPKTKCIVGSNPWSFVYILSIFLDHSTNSPSICFSMV